MCAGVVAWHGTTGIAPIVMSVPRGLDTAWQDYRLCSFANHCNMVLQWFVGTSRSCGWHFKDTPMLRTHLLMIISLHRIQKYCLEFMYACVMHCWVICKLRLLFELETLCAESVFLHAFVERQKSFEKLELFSKKSPKVSHTLSATPSGTYFLKVKLVLKQMAGIGGKSRVTFSFHWN